MNKQPADQIIRAYEDAFEEVGLNFPQGIAELCKYAEQNLRHWKQARSKEGLKALLTKEPEPSSQQLDATLATIKLLPYLIRRAFKEALRKIPEPPKPDRGGRPILFTPQDAREICTFIAGQLGNGKKLPETLRRAAELWRKPEQQEIPLHTIKKIWYERTNPKSRFYLSATAEKSEPKTALIIIEPGAKPSTR